MADVAAIAVGAVREVLAAGEAPGVEEVRFVVVVVDEKSAAAFTHALAGVPRVGVTALRPPKPA